MTGLRSRCGSGSCMLTRAYPAFESVMAGPPTHYSLPHPATTGQRPLEHLLQQRRSAREYRDTALSLPDTGQLLWAAQGLTDPRGLRTAPSAGALYPLELYLVAGNVEGLAPAAYHYRADAHQLAQHKPGEHRTALADAALRQSWLAKAAAVVVFTAACHRTSGKYGRRGLRYVHMEAGHAAQNLLLQAQALGLGAVVVGAFDDNEVAALLELPADLQPLILMPVGRR